MHLNFAPFFGIPQALQNIYDTKSFEWPGRGTVEADIEGGGDQPWVRRVTGVSTCPQVASVFNEGVLRDGEWVGADTKRTLERQKEHWLRFLDGGTSLSCAGCSTEPLLRVEVTHICLCILHLCMAMGRLLAEFTQTTAAALAVEERRSVRSILQKHKTGLSLTGSTAIDGEETQRLFGAWDELKGALGTEASVNTAVQGMHHLVRALYRTFPTDPRPQCREVAQAFRKAVAPDSQSSYLLFLEDEADWLLDVLASKGYGMAMFSGDVVESFNRLLKISYNDHSNRGFQWEGGFQGALDAKGDVLRQVYEWTFLYFHCPVLLGKKVRKQRSRPQRACEGEVRVPVSDTPQLGTVTGPPTTATPGTPESNPTALPDDQCLTPNLPPRQLSFSASPTSTPSSVEWRDVHSEPRSAGTHPHTPPPISFPLALFCRVCLPVFPYLPSHNRSVCFWSSVGCRNEMQKLTANNLQTAIPTCKKRCRYARFAGRFRVLQFVCNWVADGLQVKVLHLLCT